MKEGELVICWKDGGDALLTKTRSDEFDVPHQPGKRAIFLEGVSGWYLMSHVRPVKVQGNAASELAELSATSTNTRRDDILKSLQAINVVRDMLKEVDPIAWGVYKGSLAEREFINACQQLENITRA
jgi:hypothetical protein